MSHSLMVSINLFIIHDAMIFVENNCLPTNQPFFY